jgi:hypothetical protein
MNYETPHESYSMLVNALLRYLLCISPWRAEGWYYQSHSTPPPPDKMWTRIINGTHIGWIFIDLEADTGKYSSSPPEGMNPELIPTIVIPVQYQTGLRNMANTFVEQVGGVAVYPLLANLFDRLLSMGDGRFETEELNKFLDLWTITNWYPGGLADYRNNLVSGLCGCRYPGYFVGLMLLLLNAISGVEAIVMSGALLSRNNITDLMRLLKFVFDQILINEGPDRIEQAAQKMRNEGRLHLVEARKATRDEVFYGHLFLSCPFFYGAKMAFEYLVMTSNDPAARAVFQKKEYECEEYLVCASSSIMNQFENLKFGWPAWQKHCQRILEIRKTKGAPAADRKVMEYIELTYFYPEYYRQALSEGLKPPPEIAGTAGGATIGALCG